MTPIRSLLAATGALALLVSVPVITLAQSTDSAQVKVATPHLEFSGVIFGDFQYHVDSAAKTALGGRSPNRFQIDRVYLNFRMPLGERASVRATTDIFQQADQSNGFYNGWLVRLKYGYLQYDFARDIAGHKGFDASARIGVLQTVVISHEEDFWPRYLAQTALERNGFFTAADVGASGTLSLPDRWGEVYATVTNGPGYTAAENDRFKDVALRLSLTPLGKQEKWGGYLKSFVISPWYYVGRTASTFQDTPAQPAFCPQCPITRGFRRNRWGVFTGIKDHRLTAGAEYARRIEDVENAQLPGTLPPRVLTRSLTSAFAIARPLEWFGAKRTSRLGVIGRIDRFRPGIQEPATSEEGADAYDRLLIGGLFWEPTSRVSLAADYQWLSPHSGSVTTESQTLFLHWQATF